jgi:hypothetical protein
LPQSGGDRPRLTFLVRTDSTHPGAQSDGEDAGSGQRGPVAGSGVLHAALAGLLHRIFHDLPGATTGHGPGAALAGSRIPAPRTGDPGQAAVSAVVFQEARQLLGCDTVLPTGTVERICCDAAVNLLLVDRWDEPLNLGRSARSHSPAQGRAVIARDRHCVFPGCDTPPARCQIHHLHFWHHLGKTDTLNLALVCWFHHHLIHEGGWTLQRTTATTDGAHDNEDGETGQNDQHGGPPGWTATAPNGHQLHQTRHRQPTA